MVKMTGTKKPWSVKHFVDQDLRVDDNHIMKKGLRNYNDKSTT